MCTGTHGPSVGLLYLVQSYEGKCIKLYCHKKYKSLILVKNIIKRYGKQNMKTPKRDCMFYFDNTYRCEKLGRIVEKLNANPYDCPSFYDLDVERNYVYNINEEDTLMNVMTYCIGRGGMRSFSICAHRAAALQAFQRLLMRQEIPKKQDNVCKNIVDMYSDFLKLDPEYV